MDDETEGVLGRDTGRESDRTGVDGVESERETGGDEVEIVMEVAVVVDGSCNILRMLNTAVKR